MVVFTILVFLLVSICVFAIGYIVYRFMAPLRHDLVNKTMHYEVLLVLCKILEEKELDHLIIEALEKSKNEKHN